MPMKKLIIKYSIEFFVIVFSISVSFFVENLREELEKNEIRRNIKKSLLQEINSYDNKLKGRIRSFSGDLKSINSFIDSDNFDTIYKYVPRPAGLGQSFLIARGFDPPQSIYNSLVNDGSINLLKENKLKVLIEQLYDGSVGNVKFWDKDDKLYSKEIQQYIIKKYPDFYLKDVYTVDDREIVKKLIEILDSDKELKAMFKAKTEPMNMKLFELKRYSRYRDSLIIELEKELNDY